MKFAIKFTKYALKNEYFLVKNKIFIRIYLIKILIFATDVPMARIDNILCSEQYMSIKKLMTKK